MALVPVDITMAGLIPDGDHIALVQKLERQVSTTPKNDGSGKYSWKKDDIQVADPETFNTFEPGRKRLHYTLAIAGKGNLFADFYMVEGGLGFIKEFLKACDVPFTKDGFDPDEAVNKQLTVRVAITTGTNADGSAAGERNEITKYLKMA